jgi:hypothetical protein
MSTDGKPQNSQEDLPDWPGRSQGVPPPPSKEAVDIISSEQGLITDEWAPAPPPQP